MSKIYLGQTDLTIKLETGKNLASITSASIIAKDPNGNSKTFSATVVDEVKGVIQYAVGSANDINVSGDWIFWAKIKNAQGLVSIGEPTTFRVHKEGN